jgi:hypothetical protein
MVRISLRIFWGPKYEEAVESKACVIYWRISFVCFLNLWEKLRLRISETIMLMKTFGPKKKLRVGCRK